MIEVLYFSDREVKRKLFERVGAARRLLLVTAARGDSTGAIARREPFLGLERTLGDVLELLVVVDEGTVEGMWRDPMGDLADALFPDDRKAAYAAACGYLLLERGAVKGVVRKRGTPADDAWLIQEAVAKVDFSVPAPDPAQRPGPGRKRPDEPNPGRRARRTQPEQAEQQRPTPPRPKPLAPLAADPWALLGIARGTPLAEAKKAFRVLVAQYHPDKVAHLAPEFRELAEQRTRQILEAWERIEAEARR